MPRLYDSAAIRAQIDELCDEAETIVAAAQADNRELTDDEQGRLDEITAQVGEPAAKDQPATGLYATLQQAHKFEAMLDRRAEGQYGLRNSTRPPLDNSRRPGSSQDPDMVRALSRVGTLKAFENTPEGRESAYACGQLILANLGNGHARRWVEDYGSPSIRAALSTGDNTKGGFLVPDEFEQRVIVLREQYGVFRQNVRVTPMSSDHMYVPRRKTGVTMYALNDNTEITASDVAWNQVELTAKKWGALVLVSSELMDDSVISIADYLADEIAWAAAKKEDDSAFIGDGTSTYHGVVGLENKIDDGGHTASIYTAVSGNTAFSTLDLADFENLAGKLPIYAARNAKWYISKPGFWASMARLQDAGGGNNVMDLGNGPELNFLGYPVVLVPSMNATLAADVSNIKVLFGDLMLSSTMGDRRGLGVSVSTDRYFEKDQIAVRATTRFAINHHDLGDTSTAGPLVALKTPAS